MEAVLAEGNMLERFSSVSLSQIKALGKLVPCGWKPGETFLTKG